MYLFIFQIRLTNGKALTQSFNAKEPLAAVRLYVEMNRTDAQGSFNLMTNFPKKVFTGDDYDKPLTELGTGLLFILLLFDSVTLVSEVYKSVTWAFR